MELVNILCLQANIYLVSFNFEITSLLFLLLQIMLCITATARTALLLQWMRTRAMGNGHSVYHLTLVLLVGDDYETGVVLNCVMLRSNYFASATFKLGL